MPMHGTSLAHEHMPMHGTSLARGNAEAQAASSHIRQQTLLLQHHTRWQPTHNSALVLRRWVQQTKHKQHPFEGFLSCIHIMSLSSNKRQHKQCPVKS
jgi:hypothetical protein